MTTTGYGIDWEVRAILDVGDGDSLRARIARTLRVSDYRLMTIYTDPDRELRGEAFRLAWVDTPERDDEPEGAAEAAAADLRAWIQQRIIDADLMYLTTFGRGGFDRILADLWYWETMPDGTKVRESASQWLMQVKGWPPYRRSRR